MPETCFYGDRVPFQCPYSGIKSCGDGTSAGKQWDVKFRNCLKEETVMWNENI